MAFFIDRSASRVVFVADGETPGAAWRVIDSDTARLCGLSHEQVLSTAQLDALQEGAVSRFRALSGLPTAPSGVTDIPPSSVFAEQPEKGVSTSAWLVVTALVAIAAWIWAAVSTVIRYRDGQDLIDRSWDVSAVQIQQINGQISAYGVTALIVALALTVPLLVAKK